MNSFWYYVDCVNGSDENDGLTTDSAFATLEKAMNLATSDCRIFLIAAGTYTLSKNCITSMSLHLANYSDGDTVVKFNTDHAVQFYNCYLHFEGITFDFPADYDAYTDNCGVVFDSIKIPNHRFRMNYSDGRVTDCECYCLAFHKSSFRIQNLTITNTSTEFPALSINACSDMQFHGGLNIAALPSDGQTNANAEGTRSAVFWAQRSSILIESLTLPTNSRYAYGLWSTRSAWDISFTHKRHLNTYTQTGNHVDTYTTYGFNTCRDYVGVNADLLCETGIYGVRNCTAELNYPISKFPTVGGTNGIMAVMRYTYAGWEFYRQFFFRCGTAGSNDHHIFSRELSLNPDTGEERVGAWYKIATSKDITLPIE